MRTAPAIGIGLVTATLMAAVGCGLPSQQDWTDQLQADSPCYRVDLLNGLDESTTAEVRDLYGCLNLRGHFDAFQPVVDALERPTRTGRPAGVELARAVNAMGRADVDVFGLAGVALAALQAEDKPIDPLLDLSLELIYGRSAWEVRHQVTLTAPEALDRGVLSPLGPVLPAASTALLDDDLRAARWAGALLADPELKRWVHAVTDLTTSAHPEVRRPTHALLSSLGASIEAAHSPTNDRWSDATGDSLRDTAVALTLGVKGGPALLDAITPEAAAILGDAVVRSELPAVLHDLHDDGHLPQVPAELAWLASVNTDGDALRAGETSALTALLRLLHATNRPTTCSIDVWVTTLDVQLGNLAVSLLEFMADREPSTIQGSASVLGSVLGWGLTDSLLEWIADSESCPTLSRQVIDDLGVVDVMASPNAQHSTTLFVHAVRTLKYAERSRIPEFVDLAATLWGTGAALAIEELIRDIGREDLAVDLLSLVPVLDAPADYGITAAGQPAPTLTEALDHARWLFEERSGRTGWETLKPVVQAIVAEDGTWRAVAHAGPLLADRQSQAAQALDLLDPMIALDPDLALLEQLGRILADDEVARPLLAVLETPGVGDGLLEASPQGTPHEVPLAFGARLVVSGAVKDLLAMVDQIVGSL